MYQTEASLRKKALNGDISNDEFIAHLTGEYYSTRDTDVQGQTSANLANLSYDPSNYDSLKKYCADDIFLELIGTEHTHLILHGVAGLCNLALSEDFHKIIFENRGVQLLKHLLKHPDDTIKINALNCLFFLIRPSNKSFVCTNSLKVTIEELCTSENECLSKLAAYFITYHFVDYDVSEANSSSHQKRSTSAGDKSSPKARH